MAPILDFANHSFEANAYYSFDESSGVVLLPQEAKAGTLKDGGEITIKWVEQELSLTLTSQGGLLTADMGDSFFQLRPRKERRRNGVFLRVFGCSHG